MVRARAATDPSLDIELWRETGPRWAVKEVRAETLDGATARVTVRADLPVVGATYVITYTVSGDGEIQVICHYHPGSAKLSMMPRFGNELVVAPGLENITW